MKKAIRIVLALYLGWCLVPNVLAMSAAPQKANLATYAISVLCITWLAGVVFLIMAPKIGRWVTIGGQVPQLVCLAAPGYYYCLFSGFIAALGCSILPRGGHWIWRPEIEFRSGTSAGLVFGGQPHPEAGYALVINVGAILIGTLAYYGLREKKPNSESCAKRVRPRILMSS